jgi:predicted ABC-type ATPase
MKQRDGVGYSTMKKTAIIVAGPNGCGKTTFARDFLKRCDYKYISADAIADKMAPANLEEVAIQAGKSFFKQIDRSIAKGESFLVESTLSGLGFRNTINHLKEAGYCVAIAFVFLEAHEICVARIQERVRKGGHNVARPDVIRRFRRSIHNFWNIYKDMVDHWYLICNSTAEFREVAMGQKDDYSLIDEKLFDVFAEIAGEKDA